MSETTIKTEIVTDTTPTWDELQARLTAALDDNGELGKYALKCMKEKEASQARVEELEKEAQKCVKVMEIEGLSSHSMLFQIWHMLTNGSDLSEPLAALKGDK